MTSVIRSTATAANAEPSGATPSLLRVALAQIAPVLGDRQRNVAIHLERIQAAARQQADLIVFPELSLTGYFVRDMVPDVAIAPSSPEIRQLLDAAGKMSVVLGFVEESPQHRFYNTVLYAEGGQIVHLHRKVYLPTYGLFDEQRYFAAGQRFQAFDTARFGRMGMLICEDFWHLSAAAHHAGRRDRHAHLPVELAGPRHRRSQYPHGRNLRTFVQGIRSTHGRRGHRGQPGRVRGRGCASGAAARSLGPMAARSSKPPCSTSR